MRVVLRRDEVDRAIEAPFEILLERKDLQALYDQLGAVLARKAPEFQHGWVKIQPDMTRPVEPVPERPVEPWVKRAAPAEPPVEPPAEPPVA